VEEGAVVRDRKDGVMCKVGTIVFNVWCVFEEIKWEEREREREERKVKRGKGRERRWKEMRKENWGREMKVGQ
jgi:hypothetical protein